MEGVLVNASNNVKYIRADHLVFGGEYLTGWKSRFTLEAFYKMYSRYPFSIKDSISLANVGSDFGVVGNEVHPPQRVGPMVGIFISTKTLSRDSMQFWPIHL